MIVKFFVNLHKKLAWICESKSTLSSLWGIEEVSSFVYNISRGGIKRVIWGCWLLLASIFGFKTQFSGKFPWDMFFQKVLHSPWNFTLLTKTAADFEADIIDQILHWSTEQDMCF